MELHLRKKGVVKMIPVKMQPEPPNFDVKVRQRGHKWLRKNNINPNEPPPTLPKIKDYWRNCLEDLYFAYSGVCAYLAFHFEWASGPTTDHFVPKSKNAGLAYEWSNYRLACLSANRNKRDYTDILDPFMLLPNTFELELSTGEIIVNRNIGDVAYQKIAQTTIDRLELNHKHYRDMRARHFVDYIKYGDADTLKDQNPFVYNEAKRQKML